jgi:Domain of unknown function (DUF4440)
MPTVLGLTTNSSKPKSSSSSSEGKPKMGGKSRPNTISKRNQASALEAETLLWRALCDSPAAVKEYMADDCIMINPLLHPEGSSDPLSRDTEPMTIEDVLDGAGAVEPWTSFRFHGEPLVVELGLMAVALVYKVSLYRQRKGKGKKKGGRGEEEEVVASVSSSWRQTAGADWLLCAHHVAYADDDDEEGEEEDEQ